MVSMRTCSLSSLLLLFFLVSCGSPTDVGSSNHAVSVEADAGCTNGNCPMPPDAGCTNGNCPMPPDAGCTNGNCPTPPDAGCTNGNCPTPPDAGCTNGNCPQMDGGHEPPGPVCCVPVANLTQHLCCGLFGDVISCRLSTIPDHVVIHDALMYPQKACKPKLKCRKVKKCFGKKKVCFKVKVCKLKKECETVYCAPDWFPTDALGAAFPSTQCDFWDAIVDCPKKCKWNKWLKWLSKKKKNKKKLTCGN
jgi:hypothetical protein